MKSISISLFLLFTFSNPCFGIDNPDVPDYVGDFAKRIAPLERYIFEQAQTTLDIDQGYVKLENALDQELKAAYKLLISKLEPKEKEAVKSSQIQWLKFRDTEFKWIADNWDNKKLGSSSSISRGQYRTQIIKERVLHLLNYLKNARRLINDEPFDRLLERWEQDIDDQLKKFRSGIYGNAVLVEEIGKQAHLYEDVLFSKLKTNMFVYELLDASSVLLAKYNMTPFEGGAVQDQQNRWLSAYQKKKN